KKLNVSRPSREAQIINVRYESNSRLAAAAVPNLLLDEFMLYKAQTTKSEATTTVAFLKEQVGSYERQLKGAESALGGYREEAKVVSIADEAQAQVRRMAELHAEREQIESERRSLASVLAKQPEPGASAARDVAAFPSFITNRGMQDILQSLIVLENERSQLLVRRNPGNADVVAVSQRIGDLDRQLTQMARAYLGGLDSKLASLNTTIRSFGTQVEKIPAREIAFARLSREQKLLEDISTLLQTRLKEAEIKEAVQPGGVRVIDRALIPDRPTSPKPVLNILLGALLGLFLGGGLAVARDALDTKVRTREDVQSVTGGLPILAAIPKMPAKGYAILNGRNGGTAATAIAPSGAAPGTALINQLDSRDVFAEAYRGLRTNILFVPADHPNQVLLITSALPGDGKSTTAANLALTVARRGTRTLLLDADLRQGVVHKLFGVSREPGLTQLLIGKSTLAATLQTVPVDGEGQVLHLLASGRFPPNPAELLGSVQMLNLLEELRQRFDMIVVDTPPLNFVSDAAVLGTLADSTLLVARAGVTDKRALHHAAAQLHHLRVRVGGTVVNGFDPKQPGYGYEYGYGYAPGHPYTYEHVN
ncbi:MAG: polysaccharide biosynthesis tyrosine autokinase, partial [Gemmatimonadota bacterium]|nr:polysaccharide biosynthesis tyrosine autokinase [Gemmatimonadota bacterium]